MCRGVVFGELKRLFFGKRAVVVPLHWKQRATPLIASPAERFHASPTLSCELHLVDNVLEVSAWGNTVFRLPSGLYVHVYGQNTIPCTEAVKGTDIFFLHLEESTVVLPRGNEVEVKPFLFAGEDLGVINKGAAARLPWAKEPRV
jgi:hypothetical protein